MPTILPNNATNNITGFYSYSQWIQEASNGYFFPAVLLGLFVIIFMTIKGTFVSIGKSFAAASFFIMVISIFMGVLGFLNPSFIYISIVLVAIGGIWAYVEGKNE